MYRMLLQMAVVAGLAGCAQLLGVNDVTVERRIGGQVHGLWDGTDGVALRLQAHATDALLTVAANGAFHFAEQLPPGTSYTVTVATSPVQHTCVVDGGGNGMAADADVTSVSIACTGPATSIALSGPWGWTFDPTQDTQTFEGSIATHDVVLTVSGSELRSASMNGTAALLGQPTPALALPLGKTMVPVAVTARSGLSKTYQLVFVKLPRFRGHPYIFERSPHVKSETGTDAACSGGAARPKGPTSSEAIPRGVPRADGRARPKRPVAGELGEGVRRHRTDDSQLDAPG
jgi:hypothetical protein